MKPLTKRTNMEDELQKYIRETQEKVAKAKTPQQPPLPPKEPDEHSTPEEIAAYMNYVQPEGVSIMDLNAKQKPMMRRVGPKVLIRTSNNMSERPRSVHRDMQERQCRRFEVELAEVCTYLAANPGGFCEIDMANYTMSSHTFANRIGSAARGFRIFRYPSKMLPQAFNLAWLTFSPTENSVVVTVKPMCQKFVIEAYGSEPSP
jgi:hypothetical protein